MSARHSRQVLFPAIGPSGQAKLREARVAIVGCGALGSVAAELLVRAGVGRITLLDRDVVELSNLQRQALYTEDDARNAREKAIAAKAALSAIDAGAAIHAVVEDLRPANAERLLLGHDLLVDGTDNFATRLVVNDVAWKTATPWIYGAAVGDEGAFAVFRPGATPCLRCHLEVLPPPGTTPTCDTAGVLGPLTHLVASLQASEALKLLTGNPTARGVGCVTLWGASGPSVRTALAGVQPWDACPTCARHEYPALAGEGAEFARTLCGRNSVQLVPESPRAFDLDAIGVRLSVRSAVTRSAASLTADFGETAITLFADGRAIVKGTLDPARARSLFAQLVGA